MYSFLNCELKFSCVLEKLISWTMSAYWCMCYCATLVVKMLVMALYYASDCILSISKQNSVIKEFHTNSEAHLHQGKGIVTRCSVILLTVITTTKHFARLCFVNTDVCGSNNVFSRYVIFLKDPEVTAKRIIAAKGFVPVFKEKRKPFMFFDMCSYGKPYYELLIILWL